MHVYIFKNFGSDLKGLYHQESLPIFLDEFFCNNNINIIIGPSKEEHDFLMKNFRLYRESYENEIFAYCGDVYRFWKLSENAGFYFDYGIKWKNKEKILDFFKKVMKHKKNLFILEDNSTIWSGSFFVSQKHDKFISNCLKKIEFWNHNNIDVRYYPGGPTILSETYFDTYGSELNSYNFKKSFKKYFSFTSNDNLFVSIKKISMVKNSIFGIGSKGTWITKRLAFLSNIDEASIDGQKIAYDYWEHIFSYWKKYWLRKIYKRILNE